MKYKIGTVAKLLGVSPETLRLYERSGILTSERKDGENGYRYYSRLDITALLRARTYHQYGFSMKETESLINTDDVDFVLEEYRARARTLEQEIFLKQQTLRFLNQVCAILEKLPEELWTIRREISPALFRLEFMKGDELILEAEQQKMFPRWVSLAPFVFPSQRNGWDALLNGRDESYSALGILEEDARALGLLDPDSSGSSPLACGVRVPPRECLYTVVDFSGENASCVRYLAHLAEYVREHRIAVAGDPICRTFLSMNKKENYRRFRQVWLPIEPSPQSAPLQLP